MVEEHDYGLSTLMFFDRRVGREAPILLFYIDAIVLASFENAFLERELDWQ